MNDVIDRMRRDFGRVLAFRLALGEWSAADADEFGLAIRTAIDARDTALIASWADWCAALAASYVGPVPEMPRAPQPPACATCGHRSRLGDGYCAQRSDLPPAYSAGHPLKQLPTDLGASCAAWRSL